MKENSYITELNEILAANQSKVERIFRKHGFDYNVNALAAAVAFKQKPQIADDLAPIIIPSEYNNVTDDNGKKTDRRTLAAGILGLASGVVGMIGNVYGAKAAKDAVNTGVVPPGYFGNNASNPPPAKKEPKKKILGLTYGQAALAGGLLMLLLALLFFSLQKKKAA